jgi:hypothetical protein
MLWIGTAVTLVAGIVPLLVFILAKHPIDLTNSAPSVTAGLHNRPLSEADQSDRSEEYDQRRQHA